MYVPDITFTDRLRFAVRLLTGRVRVPPANATLVFCDGAERRVLVTGHGTDLATGRGETFYIDLHEEYFSLLDGRAYERRVDDAELAQVRYDGGAAAFPAPLAQIVPLRR